MKEARIIERVDKMVKSGRITSEDAAKLQPHRAPMPSSRWSPTSTPGTRKRTRIGGL